MDRYPLISDHGLIGDLQTAALVATDGTIDWFCVPRFDSPSVFASLLDAERGGRFRIAPNRTDCVAKQLYFPDTAVLITRFMTADGVGEVVDFMPIDEPEHATDHHVLVRLVRVVRGEISFTIECEPRFDYGRTKHDVSAIENGVLFRSAGSPDLAMGSNVPLTIHGSDVRMTWRGRRGDQSVRYHAQADDVCADRCPRRRADDKPSGADRRRAELGLPVHVGPRCLVLGVCPPRPRLHR